MRRAWCGIVRADRLFLGEPGNSAKGATEQVGGTMICWTALRRALLATALLAPGAAGAQDADMAVGEVVQDCPRCPPMVAIPGGDFMMGSPRGEPGSSGREQPQHRVTVPSFMLAIHEVTRAQFRTFVAATGHVSESCQVYDGNQVSVERDLNWENPGFVQEDDEPVVCIGGAAAQAYVDWLASETGIAFRLPSEAEWEYAARAGTETMRYWGDLADEGCAFENMADEAAAVGLDWNRTVGCNDGFAHTAPPGSFAPNPFGLYDMLGNVSELTTDCWNNNYIVLPPTDGSAWDSGECGSRPARGGNWGSDDRNFRAAYRVSISFAGNGSSAVGFRIARDIAPE